MLTYNDIIEWGKGQPPNHYGSVVDIQGRWSQKETNWFRNHLRQLYRHQVSLVTGSRYHGYEIALGDVAVGVTNGHGKGFKIYYRKK